MCIWDSDTWQGDYFAAINKDRYAPTGPTVARSAQLFSIEGEEMELLLDFPVRGEPDGAVAIPVKALQSKTRKVYRLDQNQHPYHVRSEQETKVIRQGNDVHIQMSAIRSHFAPDNIEGIRVGDTVYFHVTNIEQDYDVAHSLAILGASTPQLVIMPGRTATLIWKPQKEGVWPFYETLRSSALYYEMQGYIRVSPASSTEPIRFTLDDDVMAP